MRALDIIIKKRDGLILSPQEIDFFVNGYGKGEIPDYQAAAWAMAVLLKGMTLDETTALTMAIASHVTLQNAKNFLVSKMSEIQSIGHFLKTSNGYRVTAPEGFVAVDRITFYS